MCLWVAPHRYAVVNNRSAPVFLLPYLRLATSTFFFCPALFVGPLCGDLSLRVGVHSWTSSSTRLHHHRPGTVVPDGKDKEHDASWEQPTTAGQLFEGNDRPSSFYSSTTVKHRQALGACQQLRGTAHVGGRTAIERSSVRIVVRRGYGFLVNPTRMGSLHVQDESGKMVQRLQGNVRKANQEVAKAKGIPRGEKQMAANKEARRWATVQPKIRSLGSLDQYCLPWVLHPRMQRQTNQQPHRARMGRNWWQVWETTSKLWDKRWHPKWRPSWCRRR